jgi:flagellar basal-body rod modification protein FlgD
MSVSAVVKDGKLVTSDTTTSSSSKSSTSSTGTVDKTDFMNLLVAQMKYQDPLEPTSNTEWVSQYATFSELEQMQNMSSSLTLTRASGLVGKEVIIDHTDSTTGKETTLQGKVDYVTYVSDKAYLSINSNLYSIDELQSVVDSDYSTATAAAEAVEAEYAKLPAIGELTLNDKTTVENIEAVYKNMTTYQKSFLSSDFTTGLEKYTARMAELEKASGTSSDSSSSSSSSTTSA